MDEGFRCMRQLLHNNMLCFFTFPANKLVDQHIDRLGAGTGAVSDN